MQILIEDLLQWDIKKQQAKGRGILGIIEAFGPADEEQGRGTLHSHWQIWVKELNRQLREQLFNPAEKRSDRKIPNLYR